MRSFVAKQDAGAKVYVTSRLRTSRPKRPYGSALSRSFQREAGGLLAVPVSEQAPSVDATPKPSVPRHVNSEPSRTTHQEFDFIFHDGRGVRS